MSEKICNTCNEVKTLDSFHKSKSGVLGRHNTCKSCRSVKRKQLNVEAKVEGGKTCPGCNEYREYLMFSRDKSSGDGRQTYCKDCQHENMRRISGTFDGYIKRIFADLRHNAKKRKIHVGITCQDIIELWNKQNGLCALTGEKMTHLAYTSRDQRSKNLYNASVDRIDSQKGYTLDNIHLILSAVNTIKWDMSLEDFYKFCNLVSVKHKMNLKNCPV